MSIINMIIKNAYIIRMRRKYFCSGDREYDYMLRLTEKQFKDLRENGFSAKRMFHPINGETYWITVGPYQICSKTGDYVYGATEDFEERFLCREDIDIDFCVYEGTFRGIIIKRLYFNPNSIIRRGAQ